MSDLISPIQPSSLLPQKPSHHRLLWSAVIALIIIVALLALSLIMSYRANQNRLTKSLQNLANNLKNSEQSATQQKAPNRAGWLSLVADKTALSVGDILTVKILIDTKGANIVLAGADIIFDSAKLKLVGAPVVADSVLKMDIMNDLKNNEIEIARGNPGNADYLDDGSNNGYTGSVGILATLKFKTLSAGNTKISFAPANSSLILDDGRGTAMKMSFRDLVVEIK